MADDEQAEGPLWRKGSGTLKCWGCVAGCGACCYLEPDERPLEEWLPDPDDRTLYTSMVGSDGWCTHYDKASRKCTIYEKRPGFCRVDAEQWEKALGVPASEVGREAREACRSWIGEVYGEKAAEMARFDEAMGALGAPSAEEDAHDDDTDRDEADVPGFFQTEYMEYTEDGVVVAESCGRPKQPVQATPREALPPSPPGERRFKNRKLPRAAIEPAHLSAQGAIPSSTPSSTGATHENVLGAAGVGAAFGAALSSAVVVFFFLGRARGGRRRGVEVGREGRAAARGEAGAGSEAANGLAKDGGAHGASAGGLESL